MESLDDTFAIDTKNLINNITKDDATRASIVSLNNRNPFASDSGTFAIPSIGINAGKDDKIWIVEKFRKHSDETFKEFDTVGGKIRCEHAKIDMNKSKLPSALLAKIWHLADTDNDELVDIDEWALINYLIKLAVEGFEIPNVLPYHLIPPNKRGSRIDETIE